MRARFCLFLMVIILSISLAGLAGAEVKAVLKAGGGAPGGAGFAMLTGMSKVVAKSYPKVNITVVPGGWVGNVTRVNVGELQLASTANTLCQLAANKVAPMDKDFPNVRALFSTQDEMYYFVFARKDFGANSVEEIVKKKMKVRLCSLSPGSITELTHRTALATMGVTWDNIKEWGGKVNFVKWPDAVSLIKDGHADVIFAAALGKAGWAMELATVREMKVLEWGPTLLKAINEKMGTSTKAMPGGLYKGIADAVDCPSSSGEIIVNAKMSDEVAYALVKGMADGDKAYQGHHAAFGNFKAEGMATGIYLPIHPGALKYYKEKGYLK